MSIVGEEWCQNGLTLAWREGFTPGIGSIGIIQCKGVVVAAGNHADGFLRQAFDELRRGLCLVHDLYRCCGTGTALTQFGPSSQGDHNLVFISAHPQMSRPLPLQITGR